MKCPNCGVELMGGMTVCPKCKYDTKYSDGGALFKLKQKRMLSNEEWAEARKTQEQHLEQQKEKLILTTCPSVEGYRIKRQCGLVFGEATFWICDYNSTKNNELEKLGEPWSRGDRLLNGVDRIKNYARTYAIQKLKEEAFSRDANAVVGITATTSYAGSEVVASLYGTAVVIEKTEE